MPGNRARRCISQRRGVGTLLLITGAALELSDLVLLGLPPLSMLSARQDLLVVLEVLGGLDAVAHQEHLKVLVARCSL